MHHSSPLKPGIEVASLSADAVAVAWRLKCLAWGLLGLNLVAWIGFLAAARTAGPLLWTGALAYLLGLQHAFDADHIAAIDNVTRKLRQDGRMPIAVGFFFAVGHSAAVAMIALALMLLMRGSFHEASATRYLGELISRVASAGFLTVIGLVNLGIARRLWRQLRAEPSRAANRVKPAEAQRCSKSTDGGSESFHDEGIHSLSSRLFAFIYRRIDASWQMLPVGMIFGLGFDTASAAGLFGISAKTVADGRFSLAMAMLLPLLFAAGMTLVDTADGILMMKAYDWAMADAKRKITFNLGLTGLSAGVALGVATIDWLQLLSMRFHLTGPFWRAIENLSFTGLGFGVVVAMFILWGLAALRYRRLAVVKARTSSERPSLEGSSNAIS